eukprot:CAMPEP_0202867226 /NCGR_PEP_ID=MMETSP1391-20130828/8965_1 /ASSEMBLY_ACC=CAM_ASM_000867 /TAXON_ID=1034604 /ORGANISM="Chlamydomonas leiostraca, Strain SAG 11-49" /LENGTH=258 /DNA_ID=CAMNT_0049547245 /DNA_START=251 /DNA_END=1023 /DNA_ORIENTATION=-
MPGAWMCKMRPTRADRQRPALNLPQRADRTQLDKPLIFSIPRFPSPSYSTGVLGSSSLASSNQHGCCSSLGLLGRVVEPHVLLVRPEVGPVHAHEPHGGRVGAAHTHLDARVLVLDQHVAAVEHEGAVHLLPAVHQHGHAAAGVAHGQARLHAQVLAVNVEVDLAVGAVLDAPGGGAAQVQASVGLRLGAQVLHLDARADAADLRARHQLEEAYLVLQHKGAAREVGGQDALEGQLAANLARLHGAGGVDRGGQRGGG